jgi:vacuolar-type H+-ATPase subunit H
MPSSRRSSSPEVAALRTTVEDSRKQLLDQARQQARLIRSGAVGELTEADVKRMAEDIIAVARARLDAAAPRSQSLSADPELQATRRGADEIMTTAARQADAVLVKAWRARHDEGAGRRWHR